jgi:hypothetical protein
MTIHYSSEEAFYDGIAACVAHGLTFGADHSNLMVHLTGGY